MGRSMEQNTAIATELGYLDARDGTVVRKEQLERPQAGQPGDHHDRITG